MHGDDQEVMPGRDLDRPAGQQSVSVVTREDELSRALQRDQPENEFSRCHVACRSVTQLAVKPGPSAVNSDLAGSPFARARSSTNNTVGADMLP